jgi:hypothetical protein
MRNVYVISYEHVDYCHAIADQKELTALSDALPCNKENAAIVFKAMGWEGDGTLGIIWVPPFMLKETDCYGLHVWHVKQSNNGTSWICASEPFSIPAAGRSAYEWTAIEVDEPAADPMFNMPDGIWG